MNDSSIKLAGFLLLEEQFNTVDIYCWGPNFLSSRKQYLNDLPWLPLNVYVWKAGNDPALIAEPGSVYRPLSFPSHYCIKVKRSCSSVSLMQGGSQRKRRLILQMNHWSFCCGKQKHVGLICSTFATT